MLFPLSWDVGCSSSSFSFASFVACFALMWQSLFTAVGNRVAPSFADVSLILGDMGCVASNFVIKQWVEREAVCRDQFCHFVCAFSCSMRDIGSS